MSLIPVGSPFKVFYDSDGTPLENGYLYIGKINTSPEANPIDLYWDEAGTIPASQPIRTISGYASRGGTPSEIFASTNYSITVKDKNNSLVYSTQKSQEKFGIPISVSDFGAVGDGVTDDYAAFAAAYSAAAAAHRALYIPGLPPGKYYKLSQALEITTQSFTLFGDGVGSLVCAYNALGYNAITILATHVTIQDIGVTGIVDSGHGIQLGEVGTPAHYAQIINTSINWMGGNCLEIVEAISSTYTNVMMDHDGGYRPATIIGATYGGRNHGINIHRSASGINNDQKFIGCTLNSAAASAGTELQIGIDGTGTFWFFEWRNGLIQGQTASGKLVDIDSCARINFYGGDYEPNAGETGVFDVASSSYVNFENCLLQGDVTFTGGGFNTIRDSTTNAIVISSTTTDTVLDKVVYGSTGGRLEDYSGEAVMTNITNGANALHHVGNNIRKGIGQTYMDERMDYWNGGGSPTIPTHLIAFTGGITQESTIKMFDNYSLKFIPTGAGQYFIVRVDTFGIQEVVVEAWVYNVTTAGMARITGVNSQTSADSTIESVDNDRWERIQVTFTPASTCEVLQLRFGSGESSGTIYWGGIRIITPTINRVYEAVLASSATPALTNRGLHIPSYVTGDTTTITDFTAPIIGKPFTIRFAHAKTITHNAAIQLNGSVNFVGAVGDTLTLKYGTDGVTREVSRMVL